MAHLKELGKKEEKDHALADDPSGVFYVVRLDPSNGWKNIRANRY